MPLQDADKVLDVKIELSHSKFSLDDAFDLRMKAIAVGDASAVLWDDMSDEHKEVLTQIVRRSLEVLHANAEKFLPNVLTSEGNDMINIGLKILLSQIEEQVEIIVQANEFEREATKRQMIAELIGEVEPMGDDQFREYIGKSLDNGIHIPAHAVERLLVLSTPAE